jgi:outer membrane beta-barrel protein
MLACAVGAALLVSGAPRVRAQVQPERPKPKPGAAGSGSTGAVAAATTRPAVSGNPVAPAPAKPSEAPLPSCLDQTIKDQLGAELRPRGVQKRDFLKDGHVELVGHGGLFAADLGSSSYLYGGAAAYYFTEDLGVELSFDVTPIALDLDAPLAEFFGDDRFEKGTGYLALASMLWSPIHAKLKIGDGIVHSDIQLVAGAGRLFHDSVQGVTFDAGLMLNMFTTRWVTFRWDIRDVIAIQEAVGETRLTNNIVATAGLSVWIPTGF